MNLDCVLRLNFLSEEMAVFLGDSEEEMTRENFFGGESTTKLKFPCFQISREMWEQFDRPTVIRVNAISFERVE